MTQRPQVEDLNGVSEMDGKIRENRMENLYDKS